MQENAAFFLAIFSGIGTIFTIAGFFLQYGKRMKSLAEFFRNPKVILVLIICCLGLSTVSIYLSLHKTEPAKNWDGWKFKEIDNRKFVNERVILDGCEYKYCSFENVTFEYNGKGPLNFHHNEIFGKINLVTDNKIVSYTVATLIGLGATKPNIAFTYGPQRRRVEKVEPPRITPPSSKQ
jgi:hypothetical protein